LSRFVFKLICRTSYVFWLFLLLMSLSGTARGQTEIEKGAAKGSPATLTIPDGTPVQLRFAQSLWGTFAGNRRRPNGAKRDDVVRIAVAADVSIGGQVVIQKGSAGQATVKNVWTPSRDMHGVQNVCTCILLTLDWVRSVDNQNIPLRSSAKGKAGPFEPRVDSTHTGTIATPLSFRAGLLGALDPVSLLAMKELIRRKDWVPAGTRMTAFVSGDVGLDASEIHEAQEGLPIRNETGLVMIYRTKGQKDDQPLIYCDSKAIGQLGSQRFVTLEMDPGQHSCRPDQDSSLEFSISGGQEYYLYLEHKALRGNWKLSLVNNLEGEDGVAVADPISSPQQTNELH
jgi:hypothetical protein